MNDKKYLIRFGYSHRYLKSYTITEEGDVDDIETTIHQDRAIKLDLNEAMEYKTDLFKFLKPEIVEEGTLTLYIPSREDYNLMHERRLENSSNEDICDELISRLDGGCTVAEVRERLGFCFGRIPIIHFANNEEEVGIEKVFAHLKYGGKSFINGLTQYKWQSPESIEVIELEKRNGHLFLHKREVIDFKYNTPLEMLTDKKVKFPTTGYKEGIICERICFGNTHDTVEHIDGKTIITPFKGSSFNTVI
jgi:hypothetical protein